MPPQRTSKNRQPLSDAEIAQKAYELWLEREAKGVVGSGDEDWQQAKQILEEQRSSWLSKGMRRVGAFASLPFNWTEKRVIEPVANFLDHADIFRIIEKLSPALEAFGVIAIPFAIYFVTQSAQDAKDKSERAARAQEAVKTYLNQLSSVFLDGNLEKDERLRIVTRASTLALLNDPNLEGTHKGQVIAYLAELKLIQIESHLPNSKAPQSTAPIISLALANLKNARLYYANFSGANLDSATLSGTILYFADLSGANLSGANLIYADLSGANLDYANLSSAILYYANLSGANLNDANLSSAKLCRTTLPLSIKLDRNRDCKELGFP
jgi:uncharacterized protein YjbI with pentapeptide repeats